MSFSKYTEFHDAILKEFIVRYMKKEVEINIDAYEEFSSKERVSLSIIFNSVTRISSLSNLEVICDGEISGNVNYVTSDGSSYFFHLIEGYFEIEAKEVSFIKL